MSIEPEDRPADIGMIGLAVMGSNLARNIAEKGYTIAVHNRTASKIDDFMVEARAEGLEAKIVPEADIATLKAQGVANIFTPGAPMAAITDWLAEALDAREAG